MNLHGKNTMNRKLVYIGFAFQHHKDTHAGYHQIRNHLRYDYEINCQHYFDECAIDMNSLSVVKRMLRKIMYKILWTPVIPWYLIKVIWLGLTHNNLVFHFIYGENIYVPWIKMFMRRGNKIVCTFHQPFDFFQKNKRQRKLIECTDYVILVGNTEIEKFEKLTGRHNVTYIPHGISTDFYTIEESQKKGHMILTVGNWLRDYGYAGKVYTELLKKDPTLQIHVVSNVENKKYLQDIPSIKFMSGISDEELKQEYLKCSVLFLPLIRYTANNSLLEACSSGCNIIISSDSPDNSYIPESYINIVPMDVRRTVLAIEKNMKQQYNVLLSNFVKDNYGWEIIADKTKDFLLNI